MGEGKRFGFDFDERYARVLAVLGVRPDRAHVDVDGQALRIRFGPWTVDTPRSNITSIQVGGPFVPWKVIGARVSLADGGLTLGTAARRGVCVRLRTPVRGIEPLGLLRHRGVTVTVADPDGLAAALEAAPETA
ncbi:hypothetical protein [Nocardiopsis ansamitocini]|uniref:Uncharacterized protein n=1 Tax=Nocardiopsis ansamitocini TaxID=1670832 RepID=A0A9W6P6T2_9ACTN|nr:hypothetical protein [Nocardiopsis ansamitocini]GLU48520.1 hypothetical protein Nans01_28710 [Nocardiopsis ansamitocini]